MDPILLIIKYLFKKKNLNNDDASISGFFETGVSFPQFISLIYECEIPQIKKDPKTLFHKKMNNDIALQFLCQKNQFIQKINPSYSTDRDKSNLLLLILTKQCFNININDIISRCNSIVQSLNINYTKKSEIISINCLLSILNVLTDGKVKVYKDSDVNTNFDEIMINSFKQANAPLVINKSSLDLQNQNIFLIQLEILFDFFSEKIKELGNSPIKSVQPQNKPEIQPQTNDIKQEKEKFVDKEKEKTFDEQKFADKEKGKGKAFDEQKFADKEKEKTFDEQKFADKENVVDKEEEEEEYEDNFNFDEQNVLEDEDAWKKIDKKPTKRVRRYHDSSDSSYSYTDYSNEIVNEERLEEALLKTINVVGKGKFHFNNFHESILNDSIPKYTMFLLNIQSIENVRFKSKRSSVLSPQKDQKLTKDELNNINAVIEFLITKENTFKILKFDFENKLTQVSSAVTFYTNLLNFFFLKKTRREFYDRCGILLCTKDDLNDFDDFFEFTHLRTFVALVHFYVNKNFDFKISKLPDTDEDVEKLFNEAKIPMIINSKIMDKTRYINIPDVIFYQLQFILDAIDSGPKSLYIIETFLRGYHELEKLSVPKFDLLAASINAKKDSLEFQKARADQYLHRTSSQNISSGEIPQIKPKKALDLPTKYKERSNKTQILNKQENKIKKVDLNEIESFWNSPNLNFGFDNGIMYEKLEHQHNQIKRMDE